MVQYRILLLAGAWMMFSSSMAPKPEEKPGEEVLFRIERSRDPDEIWYTTSIDQDGALNREFPVKAFWVKKSEDGRTEPLTLIQERFSYGIHSVTEAYPAGEAWHFQLAAYKERVFILRRAADQSYRVYTRSGETELEVVKMYVEFDGGSFLAPSIAYVELTGIDGLTGEVIKENITRRRGG